MRMLTAFDAIAGCRFVDVREPSLRHEDSSVQSLLPAEAESASVRPMTNAPTALPSELPSDIDALRALILAERAAHATMVMARDAAIAERNTIAVERDLLAVRTAKLEQIVKEMQRARFGRSSEKISDDQLKLALEALETEHAKVEAEAEKADPKLKTERAKQRRRSRTENLDHLPHEEVVIEPESKTCPCCNGALHKIGEDVSKRLDKQPAKLTVVVTKRPKLACRTCERTGADEVAGIIQAPAPARLIEGGLPTERLVADIVVSKFADHLPLYRQSQILARSGVFIERSTLCHWVGAAAAELQPLHDWLVAHLKKSPKLFCDETPCPVLEPGRGETKTGYMWALARDDRPWGGTLPPAVAYTYAPGRGGEHARKLLAGFNGILQVDGYAAYDQLERATWPGGPDISASFDFNSATQKTKVLVNFTQAYYTIDVDTPTSPAAGVFIGDVECKGTAESDGPLCTYLSETACVHYSWSITEDWGRWVTETYKDEKGNTRTRQRYETGSTTIASGGASCQSCRDAFSRCSAR